MGQVASWVSDRSRPKEENPFYIETTNIMRKINYKVGPLGKKSNSEIILPITSEETKFELCIKNYQYGIFQISFDFQDKSLKYKNKADIGKNLIPINFDTLTEEKEKIILTSKDGSKDTEINIYKLIIYLSNFELEYFINDNLLFSLF